MRIVEVDITIDDLYGKFWDTPLNELTLECVNFAKYGIKTCIKANYTDPWGRKVVITYSGKKSNKVLEK